jgi:hypothetical protein
MEDRETRREAIRGFVVDYDRFRDVLRGKAILLSSPCILSFMGDAEVRLIRGMAWSGLVEQNTYLLFLDDEEG